MPTLLMVTYYFPPSASAGVFRLLSFARHLPKFGWRTVVVAPPSLPWEPNDHALLEQVPKQTVVYPVPYPVKAPKAIRWLSPYGVWLAPARRAVRRATREQKPDVVLTSGPPHWVHLLGRHLKRRYGLPWVADFRDPWITGSFLPEPSRLQRAWQLLWEKRVMRRADRVVHNTPGACAPVQAAYPKYASRMTYLYNGYDPEAFAGDPPPRLPGPIRVLHAGQLYMGRDPRPFLDAIAAVGPGDAPPFEVEFFGRTSYAPGSDLMADARARGVQDRVRCGAQVSYQEALERMRAADVLLLMEPPGRDVGVPAKLFEYVGAARPILAVAGTSPDLAAVLKQSGAPHRLVGSTDVPAIRQALVELVKGVAAGTITPGPEEARRRFTREAVAGQLAGMLDGLVRKTGEGGDVNAR
jgi:glycosyltransferase involved in cell wall biosynthesis